MLKPGIIKPTAAPPQIAGVRAPPVARAPGPHRLELYAAHEAGHAVAAWWLDTTGHPMAVTLDEAGITRNGGFTRLSKRHDLGTTPTPEERAEAVALWRLSGAAAEQIIHPAHYNVRRWQQDIDSFRASIRSDPRGFSPEIVHAAGRAGDDERLFDLAGGHARKVIADHYFAILTVSIALRKGPMWGIEIYKIIERAMEFSNAD